LFCSDRQPLVYRALAGRFRPALGGLLLSVLCGCSVDAVVYRAREPADPTAGSSASGGAGAGAAGTVGEDEVCNVLGTGGAIAIAASVAYTPDGELRFNPLCTTDADCRATLFTPVCDEASSLCVPCSDAELFPRVIACLIGARDRCCTTPATSADCIFSGCMIACGAQ
jgi:hypothetical protein